MKMTIQLITMRIILHEDCIDDSRMKGIHLEIMKGIFDNNHSKPKQYNNIIIITKIIIIIT